MQTNSATDFAEKDPPVENFTLQCPWCVCHSKRGKKEIKLSLEEGIMKESPYWGIGHAEKRTQHLHIIKELRSALASLSEHGKNTLYVLLFRYYIIICAENFAL